MSLYQVVQYHRQLRPIAPGSSSGISSGPEGTPLGMVINPWPARGTSQLNWTSAKRAFPAAWLPPILAGSTVVVPGVDGRQQSEPDRRDAPRHKTSTGEEVSAGNPTGLSCLRRDRQPGPAENSYH
jgi:hypothetical protein